RAVFDKVKSLFSSSKREELIQKHLDEVRAHLPVPVFWLFGKTQTGKTSIIKYLTGADQAEIGRGFLPCTRFSRKYNFPSEEAPPPAPPGPEALLRSAAEHKRRFEGLFDRVVCVDLTPPEEGFNEPDYGGPRLRQVLFETLPAAVGQTLLTLREASDTLQEI